VSNQQPHSSELIDTIRDLKSEIIESRNLTIKTDHLVKKLGADVRQIGQRQEKYEKRYVFNSVVAYILFSVLIFAGLYLAFQSQVAREREAVLARDVRIADLHDRVAELESELERRRDAEEQAYSLYRLVEDNNRDEVLTAFPRVRGKLVNRAEVELLRREVESINRELAREAFDEGLEHYRTRGYEKARDALGKSLSHIDNPVYVMELQYKLGMSEFKLKNYKKAAAHLREATRHEQRKELRNETMWHLAVALDRDGRGSEARGAYQGYVKRFAYDKRARSAQKRVLHYIRERIGGPR
jgi:TolA-binding protein